MALPLLQTKLYIPPPRLHLVARPTMTAKVQAGSLLPLTLIAAPVGFGKTTLVSEWIVQTAQPVAWLSLDEDDNELARFFAYLIAALQTQQPQIGIAAQGLLNTPEPPSAKTILTLLLNDLGALPTTLVLVLDDYHLITTPAIHEALTFLIDHLPPPLRLVMTTRIDPPLPLARWRARNQLTELRADDLRFDQAEATIFMNEVMGLRLGTDDIAALATRTEGWIAGLQLAALSLTGRRNPAEFIKAFSGSHSYIVDYLAEEILQRLPPATQSFLLQTALLQRLCGALCDAVTGQTGSQALLEKLQQSNLFITPLDNERRWFRYHHLFAEVLRFQLQQREPQTIPLLHQRASEWCEQQTLWPEAIHHALAAADFARAARLLEQVGIAFFAQPNIHHSLQRWIVTLPEAFIGMRPRLCLIYAWSLVAHMDFATARQWVAKAEAALQRSRSESVDGTDADAIAVEAVAMRALVTAYSPHLSPTEALSDGRQALAALPSDQHSFRCIAAAALGMAYMKLGDVQGAEEALTEATAMSRAAGNLYMFVSVTATQVAMQRARGALRLALATCHESLAWLTQRDALAYPTFGALYLTLADLLREQNELNTAQRYAETAIAHSDQEISLAIRTLSRLVLMRIKRAQAEWPQVWELLREVASLVEQHPTLLHSTVLPAISAQFQIAEGTSPLATLWHWAQQSDWEEGKILAAYRFNDFVFSYEHSRLARAQVFLAWARLTADRPLLQETLAYLQRQQQMAEVSNLGWYWIKLCLLQALAHHALGALEEAYTALRDALHRAAPEGYVRIFVDEGEPMRLLLLQFRTSLTDLGLASYVDKLLAAFIPLPGKLTEPTPAPSPETPPSPIQNPQSKIQNLIEPLTDREREILHLVADGLSNGEIADKLIVTVGTVKKHLNNIYGKLGVSSRTQAIAFIRKA